jgi:hypothetical protein
MDDKYRCTHPAHERTGGALLDIFGRHPGCVLVTSPTAQCDEYTLPESLVPSEELLVWHKLGM